MKFITFSTKSVVSGLFGLSLVSYVQTLDEIVPMASPEYYEDPVAFITKRFYSNNLTSAAHGSHHLRDRCTFTHSPAQLDLQGSERLLVAAMGMRISGRSRTGF